jgi:hypothetical protein
MHYGGVDINIENGVSALPISKKYQQELLLARHTRDRREYCQL